jgi:hypothetical protein
MDPTVLGRELRRESSYDFFRSGIGPDKRYQRRRYQLQRPRLASCAILDVEGSTECTHGTRSHSLSQPFCCLWLRSCKLAPAQDSFGVLRCPSVSFGVLRCPSLAFHSLRRSRAIYHLSWPLSEVQIFINEDNGSGVPTNIHTNVHASSGDPEP